MVDESFNTACCVAAKEGVSQYISKQALETTLRVMEPLLELVRLSFIG